jgi:hypothetical protein
MHHTHLDFLRKNVSPPKKPFSFDFKGWGIMILFLLPVLFLAAEGQNREWFTDRGVITAVISLLVIAGLYAVYAKYAEHPLIDLKVFTYRNVAIGTLLYFLTGAMNGTGSIVTGFIGGILGFDDLYMADPFVYFCRTGPVSTSMYLDALSKITYKFSGDIGLFSICPLPYADVFQILSRDSTKRLHVAAGN